jgi:hypothetical protein
MRDIPASNADNLEKAQYERDNHFTGDMTFSEYVYHLFEDNGDSISEEIVEAISVTGDETLRERVEQILANADGAFQYDNDVLENNDLIRAPYFTALTNALNDGAITQAQHDTATSIVAGINVDIHRVNLVDTMAERFDKHQDELSEEEHGHMNPAVRAFMRSAEGGEDDELSEEHEDESLELIIPNNTTVIDTESNLVTAPLAIDVIMTS